MWFVTFALFADQDRALDRLLGGSFVDALKDLERHVLLNVRRGEWLGSGGTGITSVFNDGNVGGAVRYCTIDVVEGERICHGVDLPRDRNWEHLSEDKLGVVSVVEGHLEGVGPLTLALERGRDRNILHSVTDRREFDKGRISTLEDHADSERIDDDLTVAELEGICVGDFRSHVADTVIAGHRDHQRKGDAEKVCKRYVKDM